MTRVTYDDDFVNLSFKQQKSQITKRIQSGTKLEEIFVLSDPIIWFCIKRINFALFVFLIESGYDINFVFKDISLFIQTVTYVKREHIDMRFFEALMEKLPSLDERCIMYIMTGAGNTSLQYLEVICKYQRNLLNYNVFQKAFELNLNESIKDLIFENIIDKLYFDDLFIIKFATNEKHKLVEYFNKMVDNRVQTVGPIGFSCFDFVSAIQNKVSEEIVDFIFEHIKGEINYMSSNALMAYSTTYLSDEKLKKYMDTIQFNTFRQLGLSTEYTEGCHNECHICAQNINCGKQFLELTFDCPCKNKQCSKKLNGKVFECSHGFNHAENFCLFCIEKTKMDKCPECRGKSLVNRTENFTSFQRGIPDDASNAFSYDNVIQDINELSYILYQAQ